MSLIGRPFPVATAGGFDVPNAIHFSAASSQGLTFTPAVSNGQKTNTIAFSWHRGSLGAAMSPFNAASNANNRVMIYTDGSDNLGVVITSGGVTKLDLITTQVLRDVSAPYHICFSYDTTPASPTYSLEINGVVVSAFSTATNSMVQNDTYAVGDASYVHAVGKRAYASDYYADGVLSEIALVNGSVVTSASFIETAANGEWRPIDCKATVDAAGSNSFLLRTADGVDASTKSNDFTPINTPTDSLDTPSTVYPIWNVLDKDDGITSITNGGLTVVTAGSNGSIRATISLPAMKTYWIVYSDAINGGGTQVAGIMPASQPPTNNMNDIGKLGYGIDCSFSDRKFTNGTASAYGTYTQANGAYYMFAFDQPGGKLWVGFNGTWLASGDPATDANPTFTGISTSTEYLIAVSDNTVSGTFTLNCGATTLPTAAPTGFVELNSANIYANDPPASAASVTPLTGSFTGNASTDGPYIYLGYAPDEAGSSTINGNAITWGTHARATANGLKIITSSASYNTAGSNTYSIAVEVASYGATPAKAR
jgi:hypothetical protein